MTDEPGAEDSGPEAQPETEKDAEKVWVEDAQGERPFMRGILVHSLMSRGLGFDEALAAANGVRDRIRGRGRVGRDDIAKLVSELLGDKTPGAHQPPLPLPAEILIDGPKGARPFSKGTLSQSLLAASIDPNDAFEVARQIELDLRRRGTRRLSRRDLRERAEAVLEQRYGPRTAGRYRVWRRYQKPERPVIVLVGGATGSGKTAVALEVALRLGIDRVLTTDSIRAVMRGALSRELMPALHASSFDAYRHLNMDPVGAGLVVGGFMAQVAAVSVGVRAIMDRAIEENTSLVLDGVSLVPGLIDLDAYAGVADVLYLVVARLDEDAFRDHFEARGGQSRREASRYMENLDAILEIQDYILDLADRYNVPIVDNVSLEGSVMLIIRHVVETLGKRGGLDEF